MTQDMTQTGESSVESWLTDEYRTLPEDAARLGEIRETLDADGVVELRDFLTPEAHTRLKQEILDLESAATRSSEGANQKYALKGDHLRDTVVGKLARSDYRSRSSTASSVGGPDGSRGSTPRSGRTRSCPGSTSCAARAT